MFSKRIMMGGISSLVPSGFTEALFTPKYFRYAGSFYYGFKDTSGSVIGTPPQPRLGYTEISVEDGIVYCTRPFYVASSGNLYKQWDKISDEDYDLFKACQQMVLWLQNE